MHLKSIEQKRFYTNKNNYFRYKREKNENLNKKV